VKETNSDTKKVYIYVIDKDIDHQRVMRSLSYAQAFYTGCVIEALFPGQVIPGYKSKKLPLNLYHEFKISSRNNQFGIV
jgi:hypothetical protein